MNTNIVPPYPADRPARTTQISERFAQTEAVLRELDKAISEMEARLVQVIIPLDAVPPVIRNEKQVEQQLLAPLAIMMDSNIALIRILTARIESITQRVQV